VDPIKSFKKTLVHFVFSVEFMSANIEDLQFLSFCVKLICEM